MSSVSTRSVRIAGAPTLTTALIALVAAHAIAQPPLLPISSAPTCARCSIEMEEVAILELPSDSLSFKRGTWAEVTRLPDGRFLVIGINETPSPALLDERGNFVRLLSRSGTGPGEYQSPYKIVIAPHDTVWVIESAGRRHVYAPDMRWVRSEQFRTVGPMLVAPNGNMVVARRIPDAERAGYPLHLMRPDGQIIQSFGVEDPVMDPRRMQAVGEDPIASLLRYLVPGSGGTYWAYTPHKFLLERYDFEGRLLTQARHLLDGWYREATETRPSMAEFRGAAATTITESQDPDVLWLVYPMRNSSYRPNDSLFTATDRERATMSDIVIEAVDTRTMQVIANRRIPRASVLRMNNAPDMLAFYRALDEERIFMSYSVRQLRLIRP